MDAMNAVVSAINNVLWSYVLIVVLVGCGIYFTLSTHLVQLRLLPEMLRLLTEGIGKKTEGDAISSFQAFCVSTASRVASATSQASRLPSSRAAPAPSSGCGPSPSSAARQASSRARSPRSTSCRAATASSTAARPTTSRTPCTSGVAKLFAFLISVTFGLIYVSVQANTIALSAQTAFGIEPIYSAAFLCVLTASSSSAACRVSRSSPSSSCPSWPASTS